MHIYSVRHIYRDSYALRQLLCICISFEYHKLVGVFIKQSLPPESSESAESEVIEVKPTEPEVIEVKPAESET